jgi:hypothetical protein
MKKTIIVIAMIAAHICFANQTIINLPAQTWYSVPNSHMRNVCPPYPGFGNACACACAVGAWSGGSYNTQRNWMIVWGGGHHDYYGNEVYAFDVNTLTWDTLTHNSWLELGGGSISTCQDPLPDGTANSRHTYDGLAYIEHADRMLAFGGSLSCRGGNSGSLTWTFDFETTTWHNMQPSGTNPRGAYCIIARYHKKSKLVYLHDNHYLYEYDYDSNSYTRISDYFYLGNNRVGTIDTKRDLFIIMGLGDLYVYDIGNRNFERQNLSTTGDTEIINGNAPGIKYDPAADRVVAWTDVKVYSLNMDTKVWTSVNAPNHPPAYDNSGDMFGRWQYIPDFNAFIAVTDVDENVHIYKNTTGAGVSSDQFKGFSGSLDISVNPNPFNTAVEIDVGALCNSSDRHFSIMPLHLSIYDIHGRLITNIQMNNNKNTWKPSNLPAGIYLLQVKTINRTLTKRLFLMK